MENVAKMRQRSQVKRSVRSNFISFPFCGLIGLRNVAKSS